jgi:hypothetical protein
MEQKATGDPPNSTKNQLVFLSLAGHRSGRTGPGTGQPGHQPDPEPVPSGQVPVKKASPPVCIRSPARFRTGCSGPWPGLTGHQTERPGQQPDSAPVTSGRHPVSSEACPVKTRSQLRLETGRPGLRPGLTGLWTGLSGAKSGRPGFSKNLLMWQVTNGRISKNTINRSSPTSEQLGTTLQAVLELSLSYSIARNTKSLRSPSSSTQTQIPPGNH